MVQWNDLVDEIPNYTETDDSWPDDDYSDASQSMDELLNGNDTLGQEDSFFESLDEIALDEIALDEITLDEMALDEMAQEVGSDKENMEDMPKQDADVGAPELNSSDVDSKSGYMVAGLLSGVVLVKFQAFLIRKIASMRNTSGDNDAEGLDVLSEAVDVDDLQNAATSLGNNAYRASAESTRNGFGIATSAPPPPPGVMESAA
jgi:hypothetical protein